MITRKNRNIWANNSWYVAEKLDADMIEGEDSEWNTENYPPPPSFKGAQIRECNSQFSQKFNTHNSMDSIHQVDIYTPLANMYTM